MVKVRRFRHSSTWTSGGLTDGSTVQQSGALVTGLGKNWRHETEISVAFVRPGFSRVFTRRQCFLARCYISTIRDGAARVVKRFRCETINGALCAWEKVSLAGTCKTVEGTFEATQRERRREPRRCNRKVFRKLRVSVGDRSAR